MSSPEAAVDKASVAAFLKRQGAPAARQLRLAIAAALSNGLIAIAQAWLVAWIVADVVLHGRTLGDQTPLLAALLALFAVRAAATWLFELFAAGAAARVQRGLRDEILVQIGKIGPTGLAERATGDTVSAITDGLRAIEPYHARYLPAASLAVLVPIVVLVAVAPADWISALVFVVTAPLITLFMVLIGSGAERLNQRQWQNLARLSGRLLDAIQGLTTLKIFNASKREAETIAALSDDYRRESMSVLRLAFLSSLVLEFFATVSIAIVAVLIGFRLLWGELSYFNGLFVLLIAPEFYLPLRTLGSAYHARMESIAAAERMVGLLNSAPSDRIAPAQVQSATVSTKPPSIRFESVRIAFADGRRALDGLDLEVRAGERLAIVGPSGAGKSTALNLLLGFLHPTDGRILIDGVPLASLEISAWRARIAYLPQRPHMFHATVAQNIAMRFDGGAIDHQRVAEAATAANFAPVAEALPTGYDTLVGERGYGLSGGEAQRLALARAFYRDAPLVLVDEASAHLDRESEALVSEALDRLTATGRTCVTVAHRLQMIARADRVAVVDGGRLVEIGQAADLLNRSGRLAALIKGAASVVAEEPNP